MSNGSSPKIQTRLAIPDGGGGGGIRPATSIDFNRTPRGSGTIYIDSNAEPIANFLKAASNEDFTTSRLLLKIENGERVYEHVIEISPAAMKVVTGKIMKHLRKYKSKGFTGGPDLGDKALKGASVSQAFGVSLVKYVQYQKMRLPHLEMPYFLWDAIEVLMRKGLGREGIFRVDSSKAELRGVIDLLNSGEMVSITEISDSVLVGDMIKQYLQELPDPLICFNLYDTFLAVEELTDVTIKKETLRKIVNSLPKCHAVVLRELLALLFQISLNSAVNSMTIDNLAIVFSPVLIRSKEEEQDMTKLIKSTAKATKVLSFAISEHEAIFLAPTTEEGDAGIHSPVFTKKLVLHKAAIQVIATTPDSSQVWTCDQLGDVRVWETEQGTWVTNHRTNRGMVFAALAVGEKHMWLATSTCMIVMIAETGVIEKELPGAVFSLIQSKNGETLYAGEVGGVLVVDSQTMKVTDQISFGNKHKVTIMSLASDNEIWYAQERSLFVHDIQSKKLSKTIVDAHAKRITAIISLGEYLWTGSEDGVIKVWRTSTYQCVAEIEAHTSAVNTLSQFGTHIWSSSQDCSIKIWDIATLSRLFDLHGYHSEGVICVIPVWNRSRSKCCAWSSSFDASICVWETAYKAPYGKSN